ncbi:nucleophile aminohydrolase [Dactylonectria macrodidyma]|uniref:Nucleophile aminohydrolase n=1 Tax=Dactylonectria macrodidyma TaxID=307937 RepID=A0A9P9EVP7_9HYPO|nr:nucleophile aminohydrolase [Dactylonectria macrodidyma]
MAGNSAYGSDGALDRMLRLGQKPKCTPAIFIHAGAGFHSHQNEHVHLQACVAAAEMGMKFLKAGSTATEAVEAALRILEDKEITNAGYGSNLSIDGTVECDATIVDHLGRSGACGAVPNVRNPIALAKLILDTSNNPLSLRRVPPNALVGEGAKAFAEEHGLATYHNDYMISKNARDRFLRWQEDLKRAESKAKETKTVQSTTQSNAGCVPCQYDTATPSESHRPFPRDHAAAIMAGTWNEGQVDSPNLESPGPDPSALTKTSPSSDYFWVVGSSAPTVGRSTLRASPEKPPLYSTTVARSTRLDSPSPPYSKSRLKRTETSGQGSKKRGESAEHSAKPTDSSEKHHEHVPHRDGSASPHDDDTTPSSNRDITSHTFTSPRGVKRPVSSDEKEPIRFRARKEPFYPDTRNEDSITDTIGAIAVDENGQIAAGSSSGGIGMKHRGRLGPAALVGVGTAVVPCDEKDEDQVSIGAVTSGTGEHMATTMASQRCAERIYHGTRRGQGGADVQDDDEDAIMESFIADDFMNHPGVKNCHSAGAIGVMVVKKCRTGYYFYFAHNTDSFALASMGGSEREPRCTMSRLPEGAKIAKGGRKVRLE